MVHRDIKPANILIGFDGNFKIADFGLATVLADSKTFLSEFKGTLMYMAPERISRQYYSFSSDIWSLGLVLLSLAIGHYPFDVNEGFFALQDAILNSSFPSYLSQVFTSSFVDFLKCTLEKEPAKRITTQQSLSHPFLKNYTIGCIEYETYMKEWRTLCPIKQLYLEDMNDLIESVSKEIVKHLKDQTFHDPPTAFREVMKWFSKKTTKDFVNINSKRIASIISCETKWPEHLIDELLQRATQRTLRKYTMI